MSTSLMKHTERAERKRTGIEPESYVEAPEPPAPVENSGIGQSRTYYGVTHLDVISSASCSECGAIVAKFEVHERFHQTLDNMATCLSIVLP